MSLEFLTSVMGLIFFPFVFQCVKFVLYGNPVSSEDSDMIFCSFLPKHDYVTFGSLLAQIRVSSVCNVGAPYSGGGREGS